MRKITTLLGLLVSVTFFAQSHQIIKHNGQVLDVNFIKHENDLLHFSHVGNSQEHKVSMHTVAYLKHHSTSNSEMISPKVIVSSKNDFNKVKVIKEDEALGFDQKKSFVTFEGVIKGGTSFFDSADTIRKIKYQSAKLGYPFVVFVNKNDGNYQAVAYNY